MLVPRGRQILSRLHPQSAAVLSRELKPRWMVCNTSDTMELQRATQVAEYDAVVLDPLDPELSDHVDPASVACFRSVYRAVCLPVVFLSPASYAAFEAVVRFARYAPVGVMLRLDGDRVDGALPAIEHAAATTIAIRVLHALQLLIDERLSSTGNYAVQQLFAEPRTFGREEKALVSLGTSCDTVNADLKRAGLAQFHVLRRVARAAHAYQLVAEFGVCLKDVVRRVGAGSIDSLTRETKKLTGFTPLRMCTQMSADDFVDVACRVARPSGG
jgi:hypothetical protein